MKRLNIEIPEELHTALKKEAAASGKTITELATQRLQLTKKRASLVTTPQTNTAAEILDALRELNERMPLEK